MSEQIKLILEKCSGGQELTDQDLYALLTCTDSEDVENIFRAARQVRSKHFGEKIFLYGFVYFSTYCHNNCNFCFYRSSNGEPHRYRKTKEEILETARDLIASGVHLIDLTMGEDDYFLKDGQNLVEIVRELKEESGIPIMISPGVVRESLSEGLAKAGADWYALYQETHNRERFAGLRLHQDYDVRMNAKIAAKKQGMLIEEGLLSGLGETTEDIIQSLHVMKKLGISQGRSMTFVPQEGTPMEENVQAAFDTELRIIAVMRLYLQDILIPASLDVDGIDGLKDRIMAGANVVTSIIPPQKGFAGVAMATRDIDEGYRTVPGVTAILKECGLQPASREEYQTWINDRKQKTK